MATTQTAEFPLRIVAEILPGKPDPSAEAAFMNEDRAVQYGRILAATGDYVSGGVFLVDAIGGKYALVNHP